MIGHGHHAHLTTVPLNVNASIQCYIKSINHVRIIIGNAIVRHMQMPW